MKADKNPRDDGLNIMELKFVPEDNRGDIWNINLILMFFLIALVVIAIGAIINLNILATNI